MSVTAVKHVLLLVFFCYLLVPFFLSFCYKDYLESSGCIFLKFWKGVTLATRKKSYVGSCSKIGVFIPLFDWLWSRETSDVFVIYMG